MQILNSKVTLCYIFNFISQAAMNFLWIKLGGPPGLKYLGRTLYMYYYLYHISCEFII